MTLVVRRESSDLKNNLGGDIFIGGLYGGIALECYSSGWTRFGSGWVKSGWLYTPKWTQNHAIAFFKILKEEDGTGYIHVCDVADPVHSIWLETSTGFRKREDLSWSGQPNTVLWKFTWQAHDLAAVRSLIKQAFTARDLRIFCQDRSPFQQVLDQFSPNSSLEDMTAIVIDYCRTRVLFPDLLSEISAHNPKQYERHFAEIYRV